MSLSTSLPSSTAPSSLGKRTPPDEPISFASQTRIMQRQGRRLAVRLETPYWEQLEAFAEADGVAVADLVHRIVARHDGKENRTSMLRVYCINRLNSAIDKLSMTLDQFGLANLIKVCPVPVMIITSERKIVAYNSVFSSEFLKIKSEKRHNTKIEFPKLTFIQPFNYIIRQLLDNPSKAIISQMGFDDGRSVRQCRVRFCLLDNTLGAKSNVLAFVEPLRVFY